MDPRQHGHGQQHQYQSSNNPRFSWQMPLAAPVEQAAPTAQQPSAPQHAPRTQRRENARTESQRNNRAFSYAQTPIEHRAFHYVPSPNEPPLPISPPTPIDLRPQSIFTTQIPQAQPQPQTAYQQPPSHPSYPRDEKPPIASLPSQEAIPHPLFPSAPTVTEPQPTHTQDVASQQSNHSRHLSNLSRLDTTVGKYNMPPVPPTPLTHVTDPSPLPSKTPITPISARKETDNLLSPNRRMSYANTAPYSPHGFSNRTTSNNHAIFAPDSTHGPNGLDFSLHQPGQITHPNMDLSSKGTTHEWKNSLCACTGDISTCLTGLFCPCILYGRTSYRLSQKSNKNDPTDLLGHSSTNGHCMLMGLSCVTGFHWLLPMIQRTRIRHAYKLTGSMFGDFAKSCCCCCCVAVQNEREVRDREESTRRWAGPASTDVYARTSQMVYKPQ